MIRFGFGFRLRVWGFIRQRSQHFEMAIDDHCDNIYIYICIIVITIYIYIYISKHGLRGSSASN